MHSLSLLASRLFHKIFPLCRLVIGELHSVYFDSLWRLSRSFIEDLSCADPYLVCVAFDLLSVALVQFIKELILVIPAIFSFTWGVQMSTQQYQTWKSKLIYIWTGIITFLRWYLGSRNFFLKITCIILSKKRWGKNKTEYGHIPQC